MNTEERAHLLRERMRIRFPVSAAPLAGPKRKRVPREKPGVWRSSVHGVALREQDRRMKWVLAGDAKPIDAPRPERRRKGETALTRISRQLPAKLPCVHLCQ